MKTPPPLKRMARKILRLRSLRALLVAYRHRGLLPDDVFLASYPRSGSTWLQFMLYELLTGTSPEFVLVNRVIPYVGKHHTAPPLLPGGGRLIKTHEPPLPHYQKAIYLVRDGRDVLFSEYRYLTMTRLYGRDFSHFLDEFLTGGVHAFGTWARHVNTWLDSRLNAEGNMLLVRYKDLRAGTTEILQTIIDFLGVEIKPQAIAEAIEHNTIDRMRAKEDKARKTFFKEFRKEIHFVHQGAVGGWEELLDGDERQRVEQVFGPTLMRLGLYAPDKSKLNMHAEPAQNRIGPS